MKSTVYVFDSLNNFSALLQFVYMYVVGHTSTIFKIYTISSVFI